jgi:hypothetical protein
MRAVHDPYREAASQRLTDRLVERRSVSWPVGVGQAVRLVCALHHVLLDVGLAGQSLFNPNQTV